MTFTAAQIEGAVHQGWIPPWLPKNAHTLKEHHDPNTKASILVFSFPESDNWTPPSACLRVQPLEVRAPSVTASWWPKDVPASTAAAVRHAYYSCADAREYLAVDFARGDGFHWRP